MDEEEINLYDEDLNNNSFDPGVDGDDDNEGDDSDE